jgi:CheY-like chemotaxis protein
MGQMRTILIVDNDHSILNAWARLLRLDGWRVETAPDGKTALAAANERPPDLVITGRVMPEMDGIELCRQLRSLPDLAHIPIVLTCSDHPSGFGAPVWDEFWLKPVFAETMLESIKRLLSSPSVQRRC